MADHYLVWMLIDYSVRIITLIAFFILYKEYILTRNMLYLDPVSYKRVLYIALPLALFGIVTFELIDNNLASINIYEGTVFPEITNRLLFWFDMSFGLVLVSVSEELLFHSYFYALFKDRISSNGLIFYSALIFAAIHWSNNLTNILGVFIWGVVAMKVFIRVGSIWPLIIAHTLVNFVLFTEMLPESWFKIDI